MSGSSSGSGSAFGSGFSGQSGGSGCDIEFDTVLGSPDPVQVTSLTVDEELVLSLLDLPPAVVVNRMTGEFVGGVTQYAAALRSCMQRGFSYQARVLDISGGAVRVHIHQASR